MSQTTVLGAGMMGAATASHLARRGHQVNLWGTELDEKIISLLRESRKHKTLGVTLPESILFFQAQELEKALDNAEVVVIAVVSHAVAKIVQRAALFFKRGITVINVAKGIPPSPYLTLTQLIKDKIFPRAAESIQVVGMGGPARASELVRAVPTAVIFGVREKEAASFCSHIFSNSDLRASVTDDVIGVELCAAMKNAYAIIVGICQGSDRKMDNTRAAFITQAIREMTRIVTLKGGKVETVSGLAGVGDLYVTVQGGRNGAFGALLGQGMTVDEALKQMENQTIEGYATTAGISRLVRELEREGKLNLRQDLPLFNLLYALLYQAKPAQQVIKDYWKNS